MIELDAEAQKRVAARLAIRRGSRGKRKKSLREQIEAFASNGWAPSAIAERFGRSERWAIEKMNTAAATEY